jgi:hypothetical protein
VVVLLGRKTSSASSLAGCTYRLDLPVDFHRFSRLPSPLFLHLCHEMIVHPGTALANYIQRTEKPRCRLRVHWLACDLRVLFLVPLTSFLSFTFCDCSLLYRLLEVIPYFRRLNLSTLYAPASIACLEGCQYLIVRRTKRKQEYSRM